MTPEQKEELRWKYTDNLIELMALQPELFRKKDGRLRLERSENPALTLNPPQMKGGDDEWPIQG